MLSKNWKNIAISWMQLQIRHQFSTVTMKRLMVVVVVVVVGCNKQSYFNSVGDSEKTIVLKILYLTLQFTRPYAYMCTVLVSVTLVTQNLRDDLPLLSE
jgi:hypothetical protein